ncbi:hypothetical protein DFH09DRAFT_1090368 [Mycena vulgaris]|nr:hypothetical protein DFH09DRAFT_1090368 [Mycena vulgaris]
MSAVGKPSNAPPKKKKKKKKKKKRRGYYQNGNNSGINQTWACARCLAHLPFTLLRRSPWEEPTRAKMRRQRARDRARWGRAAPVREMLEEQEEELHEAPAPGALASALANEPQVACTWLNRAPLMSRRSLFSWMASGSRGASRPTGLRGCGETERYPYALDEKRLGVGHEERTVGGGSVKTTGLGTLTEPGGDAEGEDAARGARCGSGMPEFRDKSDRRESECHLEAGGGSSARSRDGAHVADDGRPVDDARMPEIPMVTLPDVVCYWSGAALEQRRVKGTPSKCLVG